MENKKIEYIFGNIFYMKKNFSLLKTPLGTLETN